MQIDVFFFQQDGKGFEFLPQRHGHGILKLGTPHFQHVFKFFGFGFEGLFQAVHLRHHGHRAVVNGQTEAGRVSVVGRLAGVYMIHRVDDVVAAFGFAQVFQSQIGHDFVGVHVHRCTRSALEYVRRELVEAAAFHQHFVAGGINRGGNFGGKHAQFRIGAGGGFFHHHHAAHEFGNIGNLLLGNFEVFCRAQGVYAPIGIIWNFAFAQ